jgi:hypothetical protein
MKILKYLILFLTIYFSANVVYWGYQEYIYYDDTQRIQFLGNTINISRVRIEEVQQIIDKERKKLDIKKENLDNLLLEKKYVQYNSLINDYNQSVDSLNRLVLEYEDLIKIYNYNIKTINELLIKSGTRNYIFPIHAYSPELYEEIK